MLLMSSILLFLLISFLPEFECNKPVVQTPWGIIQGFLYDLEPNHRLNVFLGIPFAVPPVGYLRFQRTPMLKATHKGVYYADHFRPGCMQTEENAKYHTGNGTISENCLFLNIWTPTNARPGSLYPVLVYIYGSAFVHGSIQNPHTYGDYLSAYGDIIVVTMNYRLEILGSAYGGHNNLPDLPGNMNVHDSIQALHWVHHNIKYFGGNPDQVTLAGMSSGSIMASFIFISKSVPEGFFNKLVLMSGVTVEPVSCLTPKYCLNHTKTVSNVVGCSRHETILDQKEIWCLKRLEAQKLVSAISDVRLCPMYGDNLMPMKPQDQLIADFTRRGYSILIGTEQSEDVVTNFEPDSKPEAIKYLNEFFIPTKARLKLDIDMKRLIESYFYGIDEDNIQEIRGAFHQCVSDIIMHCPSALLGELFARQNTVHMYQNEYKFETLGSEGIRAFGSVHCDDSYLFFGTPFEEYERFTDADRIMSVKMMKLLGNFVRSGKAPWPQVQVKGNRTMLFRWNIRGSFDFDNVEIPNSERCYKWAKYFQVNLK